MIIGDFHTHTSFSADSETSMEDMIQKSISIGLKQICFTDHMDYYFPEKYNLNFEFNVNDYFRCINNLSQKYKNEITILKGIELGLKPECAKKCRQLVNSFNFDFVVASSHLVENQDPYYKDFWELRTEKEGYEAYFKCIVENINSFTDFDSYGHIDYIVRYGPNKNKYYSYEEYSDIIDQILLKLISLNKALEINTAGYKYGLSQPNPQHDIIKRYKELGGYLITFGSDAHKSEHLAFYFDIVENLLTSLGFKYYTIYKNRQPLQIKF